METRINKLEQQQIAKNIEIKNINSKNMSAYDVVKTIASSLNVNINDAHESNITDYALRRSVSLLLSINCLRDVVIAH